LNENRNTPHITRVVDEEGMCNHRWSQLGRIELTLSAFPYDHYILFACIKHMLPW